MNQLIIELVVDWNTQRFVLMIASRIEQKSLENKRKKWEKLYSFLLIYLQKYRNRWWWWWSCFYDNLKKRKRIINQVSAFYRIHDVLVPCHLNVQHSRFKARSKEYYPLPGYTGTCLVGYMHESFREKRSRLRHSIMFILSLGSKK